MNMETGPETQPMEECFLLVYFQAQIQQTFSDISGPPAQLQWQYIIHSGFDPTILFRNQENILIDMSTGQQDEHNSSVELPNNRCVRLTGLYIASPPLINLTQKMPALSQKLELTSQYKTIKLKKSHSL